VAAATGTCVSNKTIQVNVTWTPTVSTAADGYEILRSTSAGGPFTSIGSASGATTTAFTDTAVAFATTYYYVVQSKKNAWRSVASSSAVVTTLSKTCK
jgi:fibronectin type 3 domain-containing protein